VDEVDLAHHSHWAELVANRFDQLVLERIRRGVSGPEHHEGRDHFAAQIVGPACDAGLDHGRVAQQRRLDLDRA